MLSVAFAWLLAKAVRLPASIAGAVKTDQIDANVKACDYRLSASDHRRTGQDHIGGGGRFSRTS